MPRRAGGAQCRVAAAQPGAKIGRFRAHLFDLNLEVLAVGQKSGGVPAQRLVLQLEADRLFPLAGEFVLGPGIFCGIEGAHHVLLGADLLRAERHRRLEPVLRVEHDALVDCRGDKHHQQRRRHKSHSENQGIFNHGRATELLKISS